jgi:hypothetical protein
MAKLEWHQGPDGVASGEYLIHRVAEEPLDRWQLDIGEHGEPHHGRSIPTASSHATLRGAKEAAFRMERDRLLRDRVIGHAVVGGAAFVVFVALLPIIGSLNTFVVAIGALCVGLRSFTAAISIGLGDAWGWTRDGGVTAPPTWSDRLVVAGVDWIRRRSKAAVTIPPAGAVRVLPPD